MEMKTIKKRRLPKWIIRGIGISLICSALFTLTYDFFRDKAKNEQVSPIEEESNISWLYQNCYLLYRDLYNKVNHEDVSFKELYLPPVEGAEWIWDTSLKNNIVSDDYESAESDDVYDSLEYDEVNALLEYEEWVDQYFFELEEEFSYLNANYDYIIEDLESGAYISNLPDNTLETEVQYFYLQFVFDENGNVTVGSDIQGDNTVAIRKNATAAARNYSLYEMFQNTEITDDQKKYYNVQMPSNCQVTFCISKTSWEEMQRQGIYYINYQNNNDFYLYNYSEWQTFQYSGIEDLLFLLLCVTAVIAIFLPGTIQAEERKRHKLLQMPLELVVTGSIVLIAAADPITELAYRVSYGNFIEELRVMIFYKAAGILVYLINLLIVAAYFFCAWFAGICLREIRETGFGEYIRQRWIFYRIFPYVKGKTKALYDAVSHFDVTKKANKLILKVVLVNAVVVFIISSLWVGGFAVAVVYSIILYLILRKYISDLQKNYSVLLGALNKIAEGDLNVAITEDLGVFEPFKPNVIRIQRGFQKAVEEEVKSQKMKSELITNVSHDLKTPLTAIITYVNLLKEENLTEEQRKEYLDILSRKSLRLKGLIEDLFEVSKANSQNMPLNLMDVDIINLIKQVSFEMSDKMADSRLDVRMNLPEQKIVLSLDSQKTYRIYENLFGNVAKYALPGTRVYVDAVLHEDTIEITLKNITAEEISVNAEDLTERFVRGDASRNTEGSGLGLAIAKSFTELQNGQLSIQVDGDLFKVITVWKLK